MSQKKDFVYSNQSEPHRARTKQILKEHPQVRSLIGKNPFSALAIISIVALQIVLAFVLQDQSWWLVFLTAYIIGAFADHALFVLIHECAHKLIFKNKSLNKIAGIIANLPLVFASSVSFERYHLKHHSFQGVHELDGDLPNKWEAKLINNYFIGKAIWLLFYPFFQLFRLSRLKEIKPFDGWVALNWLVQILFVTTIIYFFGIKSFIFLLASFFFSVGLHPLGARWIQEHYLTHSEEQETYSYYGPFNKLAFNVGFHNEHHDFPSIPWNKLPQLKNTAPGFYNNLFSHRSWTLLFLRFLFDKEISLYSRIVRKNRGAVVITDESKPDLDLVAAKA
ncbi:MAG: fatty acid desaturase [Chitinophagaceae bacterium]|nr:fatty acid desaturase [Chitinophagaceae bacterium]